MNFQNLEYFTVTAEEGNITRAAERLHVSQQALSSHIARLEEELGCVLFQRRPSLELTYSGKCFLESAHRMLDINRQTCSIIDDINNNTRGELRIGISHSRGQAILPLLIPEFSQKYPHAELSIIEGSTKALEEDLDKGLIDVLIGFMPFMLESAEVRELTKESLLVVAPKALLDRAFPEGREAFCEAYRRKPDIKLFASLPFVLLQPGDRIRTIVDKELQRSQLIPVIATETQNIQTAVALSAEGMGITVCPELYLNSPYTAFGMPDSYLRRKVEVLPLFEGEVKDTIAIGYNRERYLSKMAQDFIEMSVEKFTRLITEAREKNITVR